jgi:hypothetical protein
LTAPLQKEKKGYLLLLALLVAAAYFPVFLHLFSLKNDALVYFLPLRHQVSCAIREGHFAWWSDAIYLGTPLYSDIQSGAWNPLVLLLSFFGKYNMTMLETELSIYLLAAAWGMYKLAGRFSDSPQIRLLIALSYTCSGFMTDSGSFIPWMNAAAVLPFMFCYFIRTLEHPSWRSTIPLSLSAFLLLTAGYPSFLVFAGYVMAGVLVYLLFSYRKKWAVIRPVLTQLLLFLGLSMLLWSPVLYAWTDYLSYYQRGNAVPLSFAQINPFPPEGILSVLVPSALTPGSDWLNTDVSMRNMSVGLFAFLFFPLSFHMVFKSRILKVVAGISLLSLLISMGDATPVHKWCYQLLPFFDRFRHPGTLRLFAITGLLLMAVTSFERLYRNDPDAIRPSRLIAWMALMALLVLTGYGFFSAGILQPGFFDKGLSALSKMELPDLLLLQGIVQLIFISSFLVISYRKKHRWLPFLVAAQVIVAGWIALPLTVVSKTRASIIDQEIAALSATKTRQPVITLMSHADRIQGPDAPSVILPSFYNNIPVFNHDIISPTVSTRYTRFLNDPVKSRIATGLPWAFFSTSAQLTESTRVPDPKVAVVELIQKKQNSLVFRIHADQTGYLYLFRQYHHRWEVLVNGKSGTIQLADDAFIVVPVKDGISTVELSYNPGRTQLLLSVICLFVFSGLLLVLLTTFSWPKKQKKSA